MIISIIQIIISYEQNILLIFYVNDGSHVRLQHPSCVYITAQGQYTAVLKMCTLLKWLSLPYILGLSQNHHCAFLYCCYKVYVFPRNSSLHQRRHSKFSQYFGELKNPLKGLKDKHMNGKSNYNLKSLLTNASCN